MIGNGNVALDVARMLVLAPSELAPTDTADHALDVLARAPPSPRSSSSAAAAPPRRPSPTPSCSSSASSPTPTSSSTPPSSSAALAVSDPDAEHRPHRRRNVEILRAYAATAPVGRRKRIVLRFLLSPISLIPDEHGRLGAVELVRNELVPDAERRPARRAHRRARDDPSRPRLPRDRLPRHPPARRPLRRARGQIPNDGGRVLDPPPAPRFPASTSSAGSSAAPPA